MPDDRLTTPHRVAMVITELEPGGAERCLTELAVRLDPTRFQVRVITLADKPRQPLLADRLQAAGIPIDFLQGKHWWEFPVVLRRLKKRFSETRPHLVQSFLFHANVLTALSGYGPLVWGERVREPSRWRLWVERTLARRVERIVCVSEAVQRYLIGQGGLSPDRLLVIANGVDWLRIEQAASIGRDSLPAPARRLIAFVGRLHRQKGVDWLLRAARPLLDRLPEHDLVLAGDGPLRPQVERMAAQILGGRIHVLGWYPNVPGLLRHCDLLILPSRWEGMPNVVLEAMVVGTPVLVTPVEGVAELLAETMTPQSVAFGDTEALVEKAQRLIYDTRLRSSVQHANQQRVKHCFDIRTMVSKYEHLYDSLIIPGQLAPPAVGCNP